MDAFLTLSVSLDAGDDEIRRAYLAKVKAYPPDSHPKMFQDIQKAYDNIQNSKKRAHYLLFNEELPFETPMAAVPALARAYKQNRKPLPGTDFMELLKTHV